MSNKSISWKEVGKNAQQNWVVIDNQVYDPTNFLEKHPGGSAVIRNKAGKDITRFFNDMGHSQNARTILKDLKVGNIDTNSQPEEWQKDQDIKLMWKSAVLTVIVLGFLYWTWASIV